MRENIGFQRKLKLFFFGALLSVVFMSCMTTITTSVRRPAELDVGGAKTIAVLPFKTDGANRNVSEGFFLDMKRWIDITLGKEDDLNEMSDYLTSYLNKKITESDFYDLISATAARAALEGGSKAPCDIYLTGYFSNYKNHIEEVQEKKTRTVNNKVETYYERKYKREVNLRINYEIIDSETNKILASAYESISETSSLYDTRRKIPSAPSMLRYKIEKLSDNIIKKIQPYYENVNLTLLSDKTKDPLMKEANKLAKDRHLEASKELFLKLYKMQGYMEAGYNAAIITQAQGDLEGARTLMKEVADKYRETKAYNALANIDAEIKSAERLKKQLESK